MATRSLILAAGLFVVTCGAGAQSQPLPTPPSVLPAPPSLPGPPSRIPAVGIPTPPTAPPLIPAAPSLPEAPAEKSIEQLLKELEGVQAQKADILKREADLKAAVQKKLEGLRKQADKLGAGSVPGAAKAGVPARVGSIQLKGFAKKDEEKVIQAVGMRPGQIIRYPEFEAARERIEKLGYKSVEVVELPNEMASEFKDILVRCDPATAGR